MGTSAAIAITVPSASAFIGFASLLAAGFVVAWSALLWLTVRRLTRPPRRTAGYAITHGLPESPDKLFAASHGTPPQHTSWTVRTHDGLELPVWEITGNHPDGPTVIFSHGWGESRWMAWPRILALLDVSSRIICYDLRGHGESPAHSRCGLGIPEVSDLTALVEMVCGRQPIRQSKTFSDHTDRELPIILYGFSLGAGVSIAAAGSPHLAGRVAMVIAEAPYRLPQTPAMAVLRNSDTPFRLNTIPAIYTASTIFAGGGLAPVARIGGPFDRLTHAARIPCPLVVIHGDADTVCPPLDGQQIAAATPRGRYQPVPTAGHLDLWQMPFATITAALLIAAIKGVPRPSQSTPIP